MKLFSLIFIVTIANTAGILGQATNRPEPALVINGTPVDNAVKTIGGKTYVDLDAISKPLNISVKKSASVVVVESGSSDGKTLSSSSTTVFGNLSYYFNRNFGNKPDVGSKVFLLEANEQFSFQSSDFVLFIGDKVIVTPDANGKKEYAILYSTASDGNGRFEFKGVKAGTYWLLAQSAHAKGNSKAEVSGKLLSKKIEIAVGQTIDVSHDFGMTYF